jgi:hypothetical protein
MCSWLKQFSLLVHRTKIFNQEFKPALTRRNLSDIIDMIIAMNLAIKIYYFFNFPMTGWVWFLWLIQ